MAVQSEWKAVGKIKTIFRYPVKGMKGQALDDAELYWHGVRGDRLVALVNRDDVNSGFPWLTGRKKAMMIRYQPIGDVETGEFSVNTPDGYQYPLTSPDLKSELGELFGKSLDWVRISRGCFDAMPLSFISTATVDYLCNQVGEPSDPRRFRPNLLIETQAVDPFSEEEWLNATLQFGEGEHAPQVFVARHNVRCSMTNLDPDTASANPAMLKLIATERDTKAGMYAFVLRIGHIKAGDLVQVRYES